MSLHVGCTGKEAFATPQLASRVNRRRSTRSKLGGVIYHCDHCGFFHIGRKAKSPHYRKAGSDIDLGDEDVTDAL